MCFHWQFFIASKLSFNVFSSYWPSCFEVLLSTFWNEINNWPYDSPKTGLSLNNALMKLPDVNSGVRYQEFEMKFCTQNGTNKIHENSEFWLYPILFDSQLKNETHFPFALLTLRL